MTDNIHYICRAFFKLNSESKISTLLDLGCGYGQLGYCLLPYIEKSVGIDIDTRSLNFCSTHKIYNKLLSLDLSYGSLPYRDKEFDVVTASELLEHFEKKKSKLLLNEMERVGKSVIISTPTVFFTNEGAIKLTGNSYQRHRCHWSTKEFKLRGYNVKGCGHLSIFGHQIKYISYAMRGLSNIVSELSTQIVAWKRCENKTL